MGGGYGVGIGAGWLSMLGMGLFWVLVLVLNVWAVLALMGGGRTRDGREEALETLRRRFASGEISQAEYEQARRVLQ